MMMQEFEQRTGFFPTAAMYEVIEKAYAEFDGDKDLFCTRYKKNTDGFAERIQQMANLEAISREWVMARDLSSQNTEIARLKKALEQEQEWRPYECEKNVGQKDYAELAECVPSGAAQYMSDEEALGWVCHEFGFDRSKVTILHEIELKEINRHGLWRRTGKKIDRRPIYCATDYNYVRFNVGGWQWEVMNGKLLPFTD